MDENSILAAIDEEITKLQRVRALLADATSISSRRGVGRPKGSVSAANSQTRRTLSAEARARIAAAQRKRWAASKKSQK